MQDTQATQEIFPPDLVTDRLITNAQVLELTNIGRTSLWKLEKAGKFPSAVTTGTTLKLWKFSSVQEWIKNLEPAPLNKADG